MPGTTTSVNSRSNGSPRSICRSASGLPKPFRPAALRQMLAE
ncbi:MAG TPA: hypothetical protein PLO41_23845 [Rubrivivax sp.]|nr:hypothetical protein [Rubrivivax sp.]